MKLDNTVAAVVTGGASGLGAATARALAAKGVKVAIFDLQEEKGKAVAAEIGQRERVVGVDPHKARPAAAVRDVGAATGLDVGAGGIGLHLSEMIRTFEWDRVAFIILMVLVTVAVIGCVAGAKRFAR